MKSTAFFIFRSSISKLRRDRVSKSITLFRQWLIKFMQNLIAVYPDFEEPIVRYTTDSEGRIWWKAYNPYTQRFRWFTSEDELRAWLDRYPKP